MNKNDLGIYVYKKGNSDKFWSCMPNDDKGKTYITAWGRNGTRGQSKIVDSWKAETKIREKVREGYVLDKSYEYIIGGGLAVEEKVKLNSLFIENTVLLDTEENRLKIQEKESENITIAPPVRAVKNRL